MALDPEFKTKWVKALRSGRYKQGRLALRRKKRDGYEYCCLGVAVNIRGCKWNSYLNSSEFYVRGDIKQDTGRLGDDSIEGLDKDIQTTFIHLNDGCDENDPHSFAEIADYIEANL